jgi:ribosomal protein L37AE/L43A
MRWADWKFLPSVGYAPRKSMHRIADMLTCIHNSDQELPFMCLQFGVKRKAVGIWNCKDCGKVKAGGAYTLK